MTVPSADGLVDTYDCSSYQALSWRQVARSGDTIGVDPHIGNASWLECKLWMTGYDYPVVVSSVTKGDGYDSNCLRTLR